MTKAMVPVFGDLSVEEAKELVEKALHDLEDLYSTWQPGRKGHSHWACELKRKKLTFALGGVVTVGPHSAIEALIQGANLARLLDVLTLESGQGWKVEICNPTQTDQGEADLVLVKNGEVRIYEITDTSGKGLGKKLKDQNDRLKIALKKRVRPEQEVVVKIFSVAGPESKKGTLIANGTRIIDLTPTPK